jgi:prevent-host-death family protein
MATINQRELRNESGEVMRRVQAGESFTVTRRGLPVADLVPHSERHDGATRFVPARRLVDALSDALDWDSVGFADEQHALDSRLDDTPRDPWPRR